MAFSLSRLHEQAVDKVKHLHGKLEKHRSMLDDMVEQTVVTGEVAVGAGVAALADYYLGDKTKELPEAMVGPVPVVLGAALALKGVAYMLGAGSGDHVHAVANGIGAAGVYGTTLRLLKASGA